MDENIKSSYNIKDFIIGDFVGRGKFGKIFLAHLVGDPSFKVAIKISKINGENFTVICNEIKFLKLLRSKTVIKFYGAIFDNNKVHIILEYADGGDLCDKITKYYPLSITEIKTTMKKICKAVKYCHDNDVVHSDIKPENILLVGSSLKLCDFGLSFKDSIDKEKIGGTIEYCAPELLKKESFLGPYKSIDIWALGVVFFEILTGSPPFYSENKNIIAEKIRNNDYLIPNFIDGDTKSFVEYILNPDPKLRPSIDEILCHPWFKIKANSELVFFPFQS